MRCSPSARRAASVLCKARNVVGLAGRFTGGILLFRPIGEQRIPSLRPRGSLHRSDTQPRPIREWRFLSLWSPVHGEGDKLKCRRVSDFCFAEGAFRVPLVVIIKAQSCMKAKAALLPVHKRLAPDRGFLRSPCRAAGVAVRLASWLLTHRGTANWALRGSVDGCPHRGTHPSMTARARMFFVLGQASATGCGPEVPSIACRGQPEMRLLAGSLHAAFRTDR